jgi:hypothetical protein
MLTQFSLQLMTAHSGSHISCHAILTFTICFVLVSWQHTIQRKRKSLDSFPAQVRGENTCRARCRSEKTKSVLSPSDWLHPLNIIGLSLFRFLLLKFPHHLSINLTRCFHFRSVLLSSNHPCLSTPGTACSFPLGVLVHHKLASEAIGCVRGTEPRLVATGSIYHLHIPTYHYYRLGTKTSLQRFHW